VLDSMEIFSEDYSTVSPKYRFFICIPCLDGKGRFALYIAQNCWVADGSALFDGEFCGGGCDQGD